MVEALHASFTLRLMEVFETHAWCATKESRKVIQSVYSLSVVHWRKLKKDLKQFNNPTPGSRTVKRRSDIDDVRHWRQKIGSNKAIRKRDYDSNRKRTFRENKQLLCNQHTQNGNTHCNVLGMGFHVRPPLQFLRRRQGIVPSEGRNSRRVRQFPLVRSRWEISPRRFPPLSIFSVIRRTIALYSLGSTPWSCRGTRPAMGVRLRWW